ncbi:hypothetical protein C7S18_09840 [Ahniella affigens]|uniref:histidine kinase n=1 Tax=Ahniella affigens TaxID=2021234 RepID=A0A2P1PRJ5_9GAMM|nr:ATP-binding protein [Ahniella affigens]AVP97477.1 hypothetical protein C7S18_09840 [Ahniella affigens]
MSGTDPQLESLLFDILLEQTKPLFLRFDQKLGLLGIEGQRNAWRVDDAESLAQAVRDVLLGMPLQGRGELRAVELAGQRLAHVHWHGRADGIDVILLDARMELEQQRQKQQESHDAELASAERGKAIDRLRKVKHELERRQTQLEEADALKTAFLSTLSHEFRTPLTAIFGYLHLLERRLQPDSESQYALRAIRRGATHLFGLAENLLEYGKPEAEAHRLNIVRIDLHTLADDLRIMFGPLADEQGLLLEFQIERVPLELCLDEIKLKQVLINLLSNAVRFTPRGRVLVQLRWNGQRFEAQIEDTGIGIPEELVNSIFKPFHRNGPAGQRGAGLGLSISRRLVEQMHGQMHFRSRPGEGSAFTVSLPSLQVGRPANASGTQTSMPADSWLSGGTALVIDDDPDLRELLRLLLEDLGFSVELSVTANEGFERAQCLVPDLVVVDLNLPGLSGNVASFKLRAHGYLGPILAISAQTDAEARRGALAAGADLFLPKPIQIEAFVRAVRQASRPPSVLED